MNASNQRENLPETAEDLVAYLDGELDATASRDLERELTESPNRRHQLRQLEQTWDLLDELHRPGSDVSFTQTTVALVAAGADRERRRRERWRRRRPWIAIALILASAAAGFLATTAAARWKQNRLLIELPLAEQFEGYRVAGSVDFLKQLDAKGMFRHDALPLDVIGLDALTMSERRQRLRELSAADKLSLQARQRVLAAASAEERESARQIHRELHEHPDSGNLRRVMGQYRMWLDALPTQQRKDLLALDESERLTEVERLVRQQDDERRRELAQTRLTAKDADTIYAWLTDYVQRNESDILAALPKGVADNVRNVARPELRQIVLVNALRRLRTNDRLPRPNAEEIQELVDSLSAPARAAWSAMPSPQDRTALAQRWIGAALYSHVRPLVSDQALWRYFNQRLTPRERGYLESLPRERMRQQLLQRYLRDPRNAGRPRPASPASHNQADGQ